MLKLWGRPESIGVQKVLWTCEELHVPFRRYDPDGPAKVRTATPLLEEPIPMVDERGLIVWESNALMRYLFAQFGDRLTPAQQSPSDGWVDWASSSLIPSVRLLNASVLRRRADGLDDTPRRAEECFRHAIRLETALAAAPFLGGDGLSMGDVAAGTAVWHWFAAGLERPRLPHLARWIDQLRARHGFERHVTRPLAQRRAALTSNPGRARGGPPRAPPQASSRSR
jgi:glutathione S-transferase